MIGPCLKLGIRLVLEIYSGAVVAGACFVHSPNTRDRGNIQLPSVIAIFEGYVFVCSLLNLATFALSN